jgi:hypothetical protein
MSRLIRQGFLGENSDAVLAGLTVGFVGLGGGGSHMVQQAAHLGVGGYVLVDPDEIDLGNSNRLVSGTLADVTEKVAKVAIAERTIRSLQPGARVLTLKRTWQESTEELKGCDIIMGAVDSVVARDQIEAFCRRFLIPYIDVGMDVVTLGKGTFLISGQVIASMPGEPCMRCCGFVTDEKLQEEAKLYGDAGGRPQVVWPNGVLASTAIGLMVQTFTPWHRRGTGFAHLVYDGNKGTIAPSPWVKQLAGVICPHHPDDQVGDPSFDVRRVLAERAVPVAEVRHVDCDVVHRPRISRLWARLRYLFGL